MIKCIKYIIAFFIMIFLNSCALYPPISEAIIYDKDLVKKIGQKNLPITTLARVSISKSFYNSTIANNHLPIDNVLADSSLNSLWQLGISGWGFLYTNGNDFSLAINPSLIFNAGVDLTYEIYDEYYFTVIGNMLLNSELIFQKKIFSSEKLKSSIGLFYRSEKQSYFEKFSLKEADTFFVNLLGFRGVINTSIFKNQINGIFSIGFDLKYKSPVFNFGLSYNVFL